MKKLQPSLPSPQQQTSKQVDPANLAIAGQQFAIKKVNQAAVALSRLFPVKQNG